MIRILKPAKTDVILDVGGYPWFWTVVPPFVERIETLNPHEYTWDSTSFPDYNFRILLGDGCHLNFADKSYEIVHSNSVIEHVGALEQQKAFASEIARVGKSFWVQTPAREFFIEPHYLGFGVHWLPRNVQRRINRWVTGWGWITKPSQEQVDSMVNEIRLLSRSEMEAIFPDAEIIVERFLGIFPKAYIAYQRPAS